MSGPQLDIDSIEAELAESEGRIYRNRFDADAVRALCAEVRQLRAEKNATLLAVREVRDIAQREHDLGRISLGGYVILLDRILGAAVTPTPQAIPNECDHEHDICVYRFGDQEHCIERTKHLPHVYSTEDTTYHCNGRELHTGWSATPTPEAATEPDDPRWAIYRDLITEAKRMSSESMNAPNGDSEWAHGVRVGIDAMYSIVANRWNALCPPVTPTEPRCPECAHVLEGGEHADQCMTARNPEALRALRPSELQRATEQQYRCEHFTGCVCLADGRDPAGCRWRVVVGGTATPADQPDDMPQDPEDEAILQRISARRNAADQGEKP